MKKILAFTLTLMLVFSSLPAMSFLAQEAPAKHYSYVELVNMLTDLEQLSILPEEGEISAAATSYDRASKYDETNDQYIGWDANGDGSGYIRDDNTEGKAHGIVAAELTGPGVIFRSWSALAQGGNVEIYIDGATEPVTEQSFDSFFRPEGRFAGLDKMCYTTSAQGRNNFVPISYNESCKIVLRDGWGAYYQFSYRQFPEGTTVESYPDAFTEEQTAALKEANRKMTDLGSAPDAVEGQQAYNGDYTVPAGGEVEVLNAAGQGALNQFMVKINGEMDDYDLWDAVQELTVSMYWDGKAEPDVWAPLGDFFGTSCGDAYQALPLGTLKDGTYYCYWYMPYAEGAKVVIGNDGAEDYNISVEAVSVPLSQPVEQYGRFHAKWNKDQKLPEDPNRWIDHTVLVTEGKGRFLGFNLHVYECVQNVWWGEGDEKFFVDGEKFPSTFGTGSEDYFGYAWCDPHYFTQAFHAQTHTSGSIGGQGSYNNVRFQISDNVPFQTGFEGYIEKYLGAQVTQYAATPYWYLAPDGVDDYAPVENLSDRLFFEKPMGNVFEGESMEIASDYDGFVQSMTAYHGSAWSNGSQYLWRPSEVGATADFTFKVREDLTGMLKIRTTKSFDFGIIQFYLDGEKLGEPMDAYNPFVITNGVNLMGVKTLTKGTHTLTAEVVGKNAKASGYLLGFDAFYVDPVLPESGIIEGENMEIKSIDGGIAYTQNMAVEWPSAGTFSNGKQLWWTNVNVHPQTSQLTEGRTMELYMDMDEDFSGQVQMAFCKAGDYGKFQLWLDGEKFGEPLDFYDTRVINSGLIDIGNFSISAGRHVLKVQNIGKNAASRGYLFGLDCIVLNGNREDAVILGNVGNISGKEGTQFKAPVKIRSFPADADIKSIEGVVKLPEGVTVTDVQPTNALVYTNFDYKLDAEGNLRFAFVSLNGAPILADLDGDTELMNITFALARNFEKGDQLNIAFERFTLKNSSQTIEYDVKTEGVSNVDIISTGAFSATARELYAGDGIDLIPVGKKAIVVEFTGVDGVEDVTVFGKQLYYSAEKTDKTGKISYIGLVDADLDLSLLADKGAYEIAETGVQTISFGDCNQDGLVNAQDALKILTTWLRRTDAPAEKDILVYNVSADSGINTTDVIEVVDNYVNGADFTVIGK